MRRPKTRPSPLSAKSFTRYEPPVSPIASNRSRASTISSPTYPRKSIEEDRQDVFNKKPEDEEIESPKLDRTKSLPEQFDDLPIELASLTDRYVHLDLEIEYTDLVTQIYRITELKSVLRTTKHRSNCRLVSRILPSSIVQHIDSHCFSTIQIEQRSLTSTFKIRNSSTSRFWKEEQRLIGSCK